MQPCALLRGTISGSIPSMRCLAVIVALFTILQTGGCARYVQKADFMPAADIAEDASPAPVFFRDLDLLLPVGTDVGFESSSARGCGWPRSPVGRSVLRDAIDRKFIRQTFHDALETQGYDVVGSLDVAFDEDEEAARAEYSVVAKVKQVQLEMCHNEPDVILLFFSTRSGIEGELFMSVDWSVYDALHRKVVYKTTTQGYTDRRIPNQEGLALMFSDAFEMATHNLGADPAFRDLIVNGKQPEGWNKEQWREDRFESRPSQYDPLEEVTINNPPLSKTPFSQTAEQGRMVAVMPQKFSHGSGFFITKQGHILTNAHVVGEAQRIRLVTANQKHKLVAEVLRVDKARDVALLKLEEIPPGVEITTLPIRTEWPAVGEDVYAIGTPVNLLKLQDTVSKGIVSAQRKQMKFGDLRQNFIQSDVETHPGNSGGPLLDKNGNIIGISVGGVPTPNGDGIGLNFFIPIGEALEKLDIVLNEETRGTEAPLPLTGAAPGK